MTTKTLFPIAACAVFTLLFSTVTAQVDKGDSLALVDLYNNAHAYKWWHEENWLTPAPVSTWYGITVRNNRVTAIKLPVNSLNGILPESFGNMDMLDYVDLQWNHLHNGLPSTIGSLKHLVFLNLSNVVELNGKIPPSISKCTSLRYLNMYYTGASGKIPPDIGELKNLTYLELGICNLVGGIPASIGNCRNLQYVDVYYNKLTDTLPASFGKLTKLGKLFLSFNKLTGSIPSSLGNCRSLTHLGMSGNRLTGSIPPELGNLDSCKDLSLYDNKLSGFVPSQLGNLSQIHTLQLQNNQLTGPVPSSLGNLTKLRFLFIANNHFSGEIPLAVLRIKALSELLAFNNELTFNTNRYGDKNRNFWHLEISNNHYNFNGIEFIASNYAHIERLSYAPQAPLAIHTPGNKLSVSAGGTLSNNTYTWFKLGAAGSTIILGDSTFQPNRSGQYYAAITNVIAKELTLYTDTVSYTLPLAKSALNVSVYPNPATNLLLVKGLNEKRTATVAITDITGTLRVTFVSGKQSIATINVSKLMPGSYLVTVSDGKETDAVQFVKK